MQTWEFLSCAEVGTLRMARDLRPHKSPFLLFFLLLEHVRPVIPSHGRIGKPGLESR